MSFKQRVSLRVEPGISFLCRKYLGDEAIKFLFLKKISKIKKKLEINTLTLLEISFSIIMAHLLIWQQYKGEYKQT